MPTNTPCDIPAEEAVLGALLIDSDAILRVGRLTPQDFYKESNAWVFETLQHLADERKPTGDFVLVCSELEKKGRLDEIGGAAYIASLINAVPTAFHIEQYAEAVQNAAGNRRILYAGTEIIQTAYQNVDYAETYSKAQTALLKVAPPESGDFIDTDRSVGDLIIKIRLRIDDPIDTIGLATGFQLWDSTFGGFLTGLHMLQARTSAGKTWLAMGIADGVARRVPVAFISLEMTNEQITYRRISRYSGIHIKALGTGYIWETDPMGVPRKRTFSDAEKKRVDVAARRVSELPVYTSSEHFTTSSQIVAKLTRLKAERGIGFAVVDYVQKLTDTAENQELAWGRAAHRLKDCFDSLDMPGLILSQVHRGVEKRATRFLEVGDSRGSGQLDEAADVIYGLTSEDYGKSFDGKYKRTNIIEVPCLKDRLLGNAGKMVKLKIDPITGAIVG